MTEVNMPTAQQVMSTMLDDKTRLAIMNAFYARYFKYIPRGDTDELATNVLIDPYFIEHLVVYANRQYTGEGFNFRKSPHPNATAFWDKAMMTAEGKIFIKEVQNIINRGVK